LRGQAARDGVQVRCGLALDALTLTLRMWPVFWSGSPLRITPRIRCIADPERRELVTC
jgi:hypothetical protein